jgi:hypothetical protein
MFSVIGFVSLAQVAGQPDDLHGAAAGRARQLVLGRSRVVVRVVPKCPPMGATAAGDLVVILSSFTGHAGSSSGAIMIALCNTCCRVRSVGCEAGQHMLGMQLMHRSPIRDGVGAKADR